jgi:hypothetical protein
MLVKKIKVLNVDFDYTRPSKVLMDAAHAWGYTQTDPDVIAVQAGVSKGREVDTLIHEIFHAVLTVVGTGCVVSTDPERMEEHFVSLLASGLASVLRDNPKLLPYLAERL